MPAPHLPPSACFRYTISRDHVFVALSEVADQVLTTGKYLNVFRECGQVRHIMINQSAL